MYRNILLTLLLIAAIVIAIELARARPAPPPLNDRADKEFAAARAVLERRIPELKLHGMTAGQAIDAIQRASGVPIVANWKSLERIRDMPVDVDLQDVALGDAIQFVLYLDRRTGEVADVPDPQFDVMKGTLIIGDGIQISPSVTASREAMMLRCYDVRDLLTDSYWGYPTTQPLPNSSLFGFSAGPLPSQETNRLNALRALIDEQSYNGSYEMTQSFVFSSNGWIGRTSITPIAGRLLIVDTASGHAQTEKFLALLRSGRRRIDLK